MESRRESYDLLVLGGGPGGVRAAIEYARLRPGAKVALVERMAVVGGTCVNTGTIPSKTLRQAVLAHRGRGASGRHGGSHGGEVRQADLVQRVHEVIAAELRVLGAQLRRVGVELVTGEARFVSPHEIAVAGVGEEAGHAGHGSASAWQEAGRGGAAVQEDSGRGAAVQEDPRDGVAVRGTPQRLRAETIVIATGSEAVRSPGLPYDGRTVLVPDELLGLPELPRSMIVVGGGVIGSEYASIYATAGVEVTLVDGRASLLDFIDGEVRSICLEEMRRGGVAFRLGCTIEKVERASSGTVRVLFREGGEAEADVLVTAAGRAGAVAGLDLPSAGLESDARGRIQVDGNFRTKIPHIFAVGDVIGYPSLAATATEQGRVVAAVAAGLPPRPLSRLLPFGIYTIPEMAALGPTEEELVKRGVPVAVARGRFAETSRGHIVGDEIGMLKLLWHRETRAVLGAHVVGEGATELVHLAHAVMAHAGTVDYFIESVFNYPTMAQAYKLAADEIPDRPSTGASS